MSAPPRMAIFWRSRVLGSTLCIAHAPFPGSYLARAGKWEAVELPVTVDTCGRCAQVVQRALVREWRRGSN